MYDQKRNQDRNQYRFLKEIKEDEMKKWKPVRQSKALGIMLAFLESKMEMAEVMLEELPEPEPKGGSKSKSTKQDSFASSFYAWKKKSSTRNRLNQLGFEVLLIRRGEKVALKKVDRR